MPVLNGKLPSETSNPLFPVVSLPNLMKFGVFQISPQGPSSIVISSILVGKQLRKVDLPFRTEVCCLGQATVITARVVEEKVLSVAIFNFDRIISCSIFYMPQSVPYNRWVSQLR